jgi:signal transduction histidine kinase
MSCKKIPSFLNNLVNITYVTLSISLIPIMILAIYRIKYIGWQPLLTFQLLIVSVIICFAFFRNRIPYGIKSNYIVWSLFVDGVFAMATMGQFSFAFVIILISVIFATTFLGFKQGILIGILSAVSIAVIGYLYVLEILTLQFDVLKLVNSQIIWLNSFALFVGLCFVAIVVMGKFTQYLQLNISQLNKMTEELRELNELKNKFLGIAAHDLRNPLTSIRGFSEIIMNEELGPVREEQKKFLGIINTVSEEMLCLVNDLLDISVIESGNLDLQKRPASLNVLINDRIEINEIIAHKKNITLMAALQDIPEFEFDTNRIAQVFDNLVGNAIKFSPQGSTLYIYLELKNGMARVSVKDEGPGISEEDQGLLFGEFQRLSAQPTGNEKSTGLGLSIVKKIIDAHAGKIFVKSELGNGATFIFELPIE